MKRQQYHPILPKQKMCGCGRKDVSTHHLIVMTIRLLSTLDINQS